MSFYGIICNGSSGTLCCLASLATRRQRAAVGLLTRCNAGCAHPSLATVLDRACPTLCRCLRPVDANMSGVSGCVGRCALYGIHGDVDGRLQRVVLRRTRTHSMLCLRAQSRCISVLIGSPRAAAICFISTLNVRCLSFILTHYGTHTLATEIAVTHYGLPSVATIGGRFIATFRSGKIVIGDRGSLSDAGRRKRGSFGCRAAGAPVRLYQRLRVVSRIVNAVTSALASKRATCVLSSRNTAQVTIVGRGRIRCRASNSATRSKHYYIGKLPTRGPAYTVRRGNC